MNRFHIFVIRSIMGAAFAVLLTRFFYPHAGAVAVVGLGIFLVGMAYVLEHLRTKKPRQ